MKLQWCSWNRTSCRCAITRRFLGFVFKNNRGKKHGVFDGEQFVASRSGSADHGYYKIASKSKVYVATEPWPHKSALHETKRLTKKLRI